MTAPAIGLFGKLPAHGDFVRRGGPAAAIAMLDRWIEREAGSAAQLIALDGVRILFVADAWLAVATAIASEDAVGRPFPAFALLSDDAGLARDEADRWCDGAASVLRDARTARLDADATHAALVAVDPPSMAAGGAAPRWWRRGAADTAFEGALPCGPAFAAMLATAA